MSGSLAVAAGHGYPLELEHGAAQRGGKRDGRRLRRTEQLGRWRPTGKHAFIEVARRAVAHLVRDADARKRRVRNSLTPLHREVRARQERAHRGALSWVPAAQRPTAVRDKLQSREAFPRHGNLDPAIYRHASPRRGRNEDRVACSGGQCHEQEEATRRQHRAVQNTKKIFAN